MNHKILIMLIFATFSFTTNISARGWDKKIEQLERKLKQANTLEEKKALTRQLKRAKKIQEKFLRKMAAYHKAYKRSKELRSR